MKTEIVTMAALLAAMLALPSQARTPQDRAPQQPAASLILAQGRGEATCKLEERNVPQGTTYCKEGFVVRCTPRGTWEKTGKGC
jgi:hypothetical protein